MRTWEEILEEIKGDIRVVHNSIKNLAPRNSRYVSNYQGKKVPYIFVDNKPVASNTGTLYNSVQLNFRPRGNGQDIVAVTSVDGSAVPYYEKAVLSPILNVARQGGKTEYGSHRMANADEYEKENRNYMYYMKASSDVKAVMGKWNGRTIKISDSMEVFK